MPQKNEIIPVDITGMSAEGSGVGRIAMPDGGQMVVFVPGTAPGDRIECHILKVASTHCFGKLHRLIEPGPDRTEDAGCPVYTRCGGCVYRHITYEAELRHKWQRVADALTRIGGLDITPGPIVGGNPDRYRNKAQFPVGAHPHRLMVGLYAGHSHRIVEQHDCPLQPVVFAEIVRAVVKWGKKAGAAGYDETTKTGLVRHLYIRRAAATGQIMVCLVCSSGKLPRPELLVALLREQVPELTSLVINLNSADTNVILGKRYYTLWGDDAVCEVLCGLTFRLSAPAFFQVNPAQAERLYEMVVRAAALTGTETVLDMFCGTGTIGLVLAKAGAGALIGVESVEAAVDDAVRNAENNGIKNARFLCADASAAALDLYSEGIRPDIVVIDPPRKGCSGATLAGLIAMAPAKIIYVSCDPATLARDLRILANGGYAVEAVTPVDMFPRTAHVETVCVLHLMPA